MYAKAFITKVLNSVPPTQLVTMRAYVKAGYNVDELMRTFRIPEYTAKVVFEKYSPTTGIEYDSALGFKKGPYYDEDPPERLVYKLEDLTGEEKFISKKTYKKVLDMGRMKDLYMEVVQQNDGRIPEEATIADIQRMKELEIYQWEEYEKHMAEQEKQAVPNTVTEQTEKEKDKKLSGGLQNSKSSKKSK